MSNLLPRSIAIAMATPETPRSSEEEDINRRLIGVALFEVEEQAPDQFRYRYGAHMKPVGASEATLIDWLNERLPEGGIMIGWQLAERIIPSLLEASQSAPPEDARALVDLLAGLVSVDAVDLADCPEFAERTFDELCAARNIPFAPVPEERVVADWALGRDVEVLEHLATNVVAAWRCWAQSVRPEDPIVGGSAAAMLSIWLEDEASERCNRDQGGW